VIALRTLYERFGPPQRTLEVVSLCEEEGSRFPSANFWGSRAIIGRIGVEDPDQVWGYDGSTIAQAMREVGLDPGRIAEARRDDIDIYLELHIEQGPLLEEAGVPVAIVSAITGIREYHVTLRGRADHAGARPMTSRRDPMAGAAEIIAGVINTAHRMGHPAVTTVGRMVVEPNFPPIVPERVSFTIDARHPDPATRLLLYRRHEALMREVAARRDLDIAWEYYGEQLPHICDPELVRVLEAAAKEQGIPYLMMPSGAVHDAQQMATNARVAMIFVQSREGRSHTPAEFSTLAHCVAGIEILTAGFYQLAY
jgi:allantoate deiminase